FGGAGITSLGALSRFKIVGGNLTVMLNELDQISTFQLPSLLTVGKAFLGSQKRSTGAPPVATMTVNFPALTSIAASHGVDPSATPRFYNLSYPALLTAQGDTSFDFSQLQGMRILTLASSTSSDNAGIHIEDNDDMIALTLGVVHTGKSFKVRRNFSLKTLLFGQVTVGKAGNGAANEIEISGNSRLDTLKFAGGAIIGPLIIRNNSALVSVSGPFGRIGGNVIIDGNPRIRDAALLAWLMTVLSIDGQLFVGSNAPP
ncbi:MAG: hypothetical protein ABJB66_20830, partial [Gemmatimonadaceae bacterium]